MTEAQATELISAVRAVSFALSAIAVVLFATLLRQK